MLKKIKINNPLFVLLLFSLMGIILFSGNALASFDSIKIEQNVSNCNNDGICDAWETYNSCPNDCPAPIPAPIEEEPIIVTAQPSQSVIVAINSTVPEISNIKIEPSINSVKISWDTEENAISQVYWGKTRDYEEGSLSEISFLKNHAIKIENLKASSEYFFKIIIFNTSGNKKETGELSFKTLAPPDTEAPANVKNLQALILNNAILLSWENPPENDFEAVRITKRENFYPRDPLEGKVIYEGSGTRTEDKEIKKGVRYYYSVFSRDKNWNYSSGAVVSAISEKARKKKPAATIKKIKNTEKKTIKKPKAEKEKTIEEKQTPKKEAVKKNTNPEKKIIQEKKTTEKKAYEPLKEISLLDFDFIQNGKKISFTGNRIRIDADKNLKISIGADKIPKNTKSLLLKLKNAEYPNAAFSFIFKLNRDKNVFEAVIAPIGKKGSYPLSITFIGRDNKEFKKISAKIISTALEPEKTKGFFENFVKKISKKIILFLTTLFNAIIALWKT